jgi:hypothetical protein
MRRLLSVFLLLASSQAFGAYKYTRTISVDHTKCGSASALSDFPVLVSISHTTFKTVGNGGHIGNTVTQSGGNSVTMPADMAFTSDSAGTTKIPWEVEAYDAVNGILVAWVQISSISCTADTTIYVLYGDTGVTTQQNTGSYSPANVWDSNYVSVIHIPQQGAGTDSTSNGNGISGGAGTLTSVAGIVANGLSMPGLGWDYTAASASLRTLGATTVETWIKFTATGTGENSMMIERDNDNLNWGISLELYNNNHAKFDSVTGNNSPVVGGTALTTGTWYHLAGVYDGALEHLYVNGVEDATATSASGNLRSAAGASDYTFGDLGHSNGRAANGVFDEIRISGSARSSNWLRTEYNNISSPGNIGADGFLKFGVENVRSIPTVRHRVIYIRA